MKHLFLIAILLSAGLTAAAQNKLVQAVMPHHAKLQYAGSIGYMSAAIGYENKKSKLEGDIYFGYVPKKLGGTTMHSLTGKITFHPFPHTKVLGLQLKPLAVGALAAYTFGKQYFLFDPENYPYNYYGFPTALHAGVFVGSHLVIPMNERSIKKVSIYYELGTNDKELMSYFGNNSIKFTEILNLAVGIKTSF